MRHMILEDESKLTDRYQTTIPDTVRKALHLQKRDKIHYRIQSDGSVLLTKGENKQNDPVIEEFLLFLAKDIEKNPQNILSLNQKFYQKIQTLVSNVEIDLEQSLREEDE